MKRFKNILYVMEAEWPAKQALKRAVTLAENNQANLTVVDVIPRVTAGIGMPEGGPITADLQTKMVKEHTKDLEAIAKPYRKKIDIQTKVLIGTPFLEIIREVLRSKHDLIIKIPEEHDWLDRLFGSDDMHLLRKSPCPVWLIKPEKPKSYRCIVAAVDVDDTYPPDELSTRHELNRQVLEMASSLAISEFADLHIVHAWELVAENAVRELLLHTPHEKITFYAEQIRHQHGVNLNALMQEVTNKLGPDAMDYLTPQTHLIKGWAHKEIPALVKRVGADLVVMGTVARTGIPGFIIGNTAETILSQIDCSVLAIKPPGFETPVTDEN